MLNQIQTEVPVCPLCFSKDQRRLFAKNLHGHHHEADFAVVECTACRFRFTSPRPTRDSMAQFYPDAYGPYQGFGLGGLTLFDSRSSFSARLKNRLKYSLLTKHYGCNPQGWQSQLIGFSHIPECIWAMAEKLAFWVHKKRNPRIPICRGNRKALDVGCGSGMYLLLLKRLGWDATGFDISNRIDSAVSNAGIPVVTGSLESLTPLRGAFGLISMWHVLEHLHDPAADLQRIRNLLSHDGTLLIEVPNSESITAKLLGSYWHQWDLPRHLSHFSPESLARMLIKAGFRIERLLQLRKTTLPQSLRSKLEIEGRLRVLRSLVKTENFSRALRLLDYPLALSCSGENILAEAHK